MIEIVLRVGFSLLVVMGLLWLLARAVRRPLGVGRTAGPLAVLNRQQLSRGAAVTVVRVGDRAMILGVTEQQVSLLGEADLEDFQTHPVQHRDHLRVPDPGDLVGTGLEDVRLAETELDEALPAAHLVPVRGRLDGSLLSPRTWTATMDFLRERTARR